MGKKRVIYQKSNNAVLYVSDDSDTYETYNNNNNIILTRTAEIGQGLGRFLSCGARKPELKFFN